MQISSWTIYDEVKQKQQSSKAEPGEEEELLRNFKMKMNDIWNGTRILLVFALNIILVYSGCCMTFLFQFFFFP